jgi:hypothetical protein
MQEFATAAEAVESASAAVALLLSNSRSRAKRSAATPAVDALALLFARSAREASSAASVASALTRNGAEVAQAIADVYGEAFAELVAASQGLGAEDSAYAGVQWELHHVMGDRASVPELPTRSLTQVKLVVETAREPVVFNATIEQLHFMQDELKRAIASIERTSKQ